MKSSANTKRLRFHRETVRLLKQPELRRAAGGDTPITMAITCTCITDDEGCVLSVFSCVPTCFTCITCFA